MFVVIYLQEELLTYEIAHFYNLAELHFFYKLIYTKLEERKENSLSKIYI